VRANLFALLAAEGTELRVREHIPSGGRLRHKWNVTTGNGLRQQLELQQPTWHVRWQQCLLSLGLGTSVSTSGSNKFNSMKLKLTVMAEACHPLTAACVAALAAQQHGTSMTFIGMLAFIATADTTELVQQRQCECSCLCCCACDSSSEHQDDGVLDASFVCEWSAVQVAAWHVNAALSAFRLPQLALLPAQLRPAAALHVYRRLRCDDSSISSSSTSNSSSSSSTSSSSVADISDIMAMVSASGWSDRAEQNCLQACGAADTTRRRNVATALAAVRECSSAIA
jgi:hypothetical protein